MYEQYFQSKTKTKTKTNRRGSLRERLVDAFGVSTVNQALRRNDGYARCVHNDDDQPRLCFFIRSLTRRERVTNVDESNF